jgi:hypothetical protein
MCNLQVLNSFHRRLAILRPHKNVSLFKTARQKSLKNADENVILFGEINEKVTTQESEVRSQNLRSQNEQKGPPKPACALPVCRARHRQARKQAFSSVAERCLAKGSSIRFIFYSEFRLLAP